MLDFADHRVNLGPSLPRLGGAFPSAIAAGEGGGKTG
jgi:hypothetical protein